MRGFGGGKFFGQRSSPAQGLHAFTRIRCSSLVGVGTVVVIKLRNLEVADGWMRVRISVISVILALIDIDGF